MPAAETEEIQRLYGALRERTLAKDADGAIQIYEELIRLGRPLSEIMALGAGVPDSRRTNVHGPAGEASAGIADPDKPPTSDTALTDAPGEVIAPDAPGDASPITTDVGNQFLLPDGMNITSGGAESRPVAIPRSLASARFGRAVAALAALAGIVILLMLPAPSKSPDGFASGTPVGASADSSPNAVAAPQVVSSAVSTSTAREAPTTEPKPTPTSTSASAIVVAPSAEPAPPQPQPGVPERGGFAAMPPPPAALPAAAMPAAATPPPASTTSEASSRVTAPASKPPPDRPHLAAIDIAALITRGDSLIGVGDITSARLFYERASDAGDGRGALKLGATYDPGFLDQVHLPHLHGDVTQALSWYRRARDLGESEAERLIQGLANQIGR